MLKRKCDFFTVGLAERLIGKVSAGLIEFVSVEWLGMLPLSWLEMFPLGWCLNVSV